LSAWGSSWGACATANSDPNAPSRRTSLPIGPRQGPRPMPGRAVCTNQAEGALPPAPILRGEVTREVRVPRPPAKREVPREVRVPRARYAIGIRHVVRLWFRKVIRVY
jgi:hypothetical protein